MIEMTEEKTVAFALCGSFCSFDAVLPEIARLCAAGWKVLPMLSFHAASTDTRFGKAAQWKAALREETGHAPIESLTGAEPLGPKKLADAMVIAPCTGATLAKLALGISDTPVTLGAKSMLRGGKPIILAVSTNDGLGASAVHIGALLQRKHIYFVPFGQDDAKAKPLSLKADFTKIQKTMHLALQKKQLQPILLPPPCDGTL